MYHKVETINIILQLKQKFCSLYLVSGHMLSKLAIDTENIVKVTNVTSEFATNEAKRPCVQWGNGEGHGSPLQCSCLENPRDRGAWQATVHCVEKSRTRLSILSKAVRQRKGKCFSYIQKKNASFWELLEKIYHQFPTGNFELPAWVSPESYSGKLHLLPRNPLPALPGI